VQAASGRDDEWAQAHIPGSGSSILLELADPARPSASCCPRRLGGGALRHLGSPMCGVPARRGRAALAGRRRFIGRHCAGSAAVRRAGRRCCRSSALYKAPCAPASDDQDERRARPLLLAQCDSAPAMPQAAARPWRQRRPLRRRSGSVASMSRD